MSDTYLLARDIDESDRLNEQHDIWLRQIGYLIHPALARGLPPNARIADIGTGTGVWAQAVAAEFPGAQVDGFDISPDQFPSQINGNSLSTTDATTATKVAFHVQNVLQPFPEDLQAKYDLVHVRALVAAMTAPDWSIAVQNISQLLKPGGTIQWVETQMTQLTVLRSGLVEQCEPTTYLSDLVAEFNLALAGRDLDGPVRLPGVMKASGFHEVNVDAVSGDRDPVDRAAVTSNYVIAMLGGVGMKQSDAEVRRAIAKEIAAGLYIRSNILITTGHRPTTSEGN